LWGLGQKELIGEALGQGDYLTLGERDSLWGVRKINFCLFAASAAKENQSFYLSGLSKHKNPSTDERIGADVGRQQPGVALHQPGVGAQVVAARADGEVVDPGKDLARPEGDLGDSGEDSARQSLVGRVLDENQAASLAGAPRRRSQAARGENPLPKLALGEHGRDKLPKLHGASGKVLRRACVAEGEGAEPEKRIERGHRLSIPMQIPRIFAEDSSDTMAQTLKTNATPPKLADRIRGKLQAAHWARQPEPPSGPDNAGAYVAALEGVHGDARSQLGRALLHCDIKSRTFRPQCREAYFSAAEAYPDDERCAFYVAALAVHELIELDAISKNRVLSRLLNPAWRKSSLWNRLQLTRDEALESLDQDSGAASDLSLIEGAFRTAPERSDERLRLGKHLAAIYRSRGQADDNAVALSRYLMLRDPDDVANVAFLADHMAAQSDRSGDAMLVYERVLTQVELAKDKPGIEHWTNWLATLYLQSGRVEKDTFPVLWRAHTLAPTDTVLECAAAYTGALNESLWHEPDVLNLMVGVVARESELRPLFIERRWRWEVLVRALALAWGTLGRNDRPAQVVYAHAARMCPEDRDLWGYHAAALAANRDTSPEALHAYERARSGQRAGDMVLAMLGHAYLKARAHLGPERAKALVVWQELYLKGAAGPEVAEVLGDALAENGDVSDIALHIWESIAEREPDNGRVRAHLGAAQRSRGASSEAIAWYREAARLLPGEFKVQLECARLLLENTADGAEAARLMGAAIELPEGQKHIEAHVILGEALAIIEKRDDAKKIFKKVIEELDPGHTKSLLMLARLNLRYEQESVAAAEMLYARALEQEPDNPETYRRLAELYRDEGETRLEQAALEKYLSLSSTDASQYRQLADMYIRRSDWERAEGALRQIIQLGSADKKTYSLLGEVLHARNRAA
jgi:tetratricopeptide (TPR) repeat protein